MLVWVRGILIGLVLTVLVIIPMAQAQMKNNFVDRKTVVINNAPFLELSGFSFQNEYKDRRSGLNTNLAWKNIGKEPITVFEVVILRYDPFNRPIGGGGRWLITGNNYYRKQ
jgi:hypothetical protein